MTDDVFARLRAPLPNISWRAQTLNQQGNQAMALAYMDARDVMERLDDVCGPANWKDAYTETAKGRVISTISIKIDGEWISKSDGAGDTAVEGEKGGISDAFKRAAVKWGIGRYLYDMPTPWAECESYERNGKKHFKKWTDAGLRKLRSLEGKAPEPTPRPATITPEQADQIKALLQSSGISSTAFLERAGVKAIPDIHPDNFDKAKAWIARNTKKKEHA